MSEAAAMNERLRNIEQAAEELMRRRIQIQTLAIDPSLVSVAARHLELVDALLMAIITTEDLKRLVAEANS